MKSATAAAIVIAVALVTGWVALPFGHAAALILRAGGSGGVLGTAARWDARTVRARERSVALPDGTIRVRIFSPVAGAARAALLVSGVHPDGIDEPRLVDLARELAATGVNVVTPDIPDLTRYELTARVTDQIEHTAEWLAAEPDLSGRGRIGMIGVSFSGGLSIVAAGREPLRSRVAYVLSFGGHGNLPRVLKYLCTGVEPSPPGTVGAARPPHDYALAVLLHQAATLVVPAEQVADLRRGIDGFIRASALVRVDHERATALLRQNQLFEAQLPQPSATLMKFVNQRNVVGLGAYLLPFLPQLGQDVALSPDRSPAPAAPVYLLHGIDDNVIPAAESELLARHLATHTHVRTLVSAFLTHVDVSERPSLPETWRMISFWAGALGER